MARKKRRAGAAGDQVSSGPPDATDVEATFAYWTEEEMKKAKPISLERDLKEKRGKKDGGSK